MKEGEVIEAETCSIKDMVLIHLYSLEPHEFEDVAYWRTQIGIATAIKRRQDQTSQSLNALKSEGYIREEKATVPGMSRKRKVYFLTESGKGVAMELYHCIREKLVVIDDGSDGIYTTLASFVANYASPVAMSAALNLQMSYGCIKKEQFVNYLRILDRCSRLGLPRGTVGYLSDAPIVQFFVGRKKELSDIKNAIDGSDTCRVIVIYGIPGIGKTTLAAKIARDYEGMYNVFWYRIHPWDNIKNILNALAPFLMDLGGIKLYNYLESNKPISIETTVPLIAEDIGDTYSILFFDDFQRLDPKLIPFFSAFVKAIANLKNVKLVAIGRQILPFYDPQMQRTGEVYTLQLQGLDMESSRQMFRNRAIDDEEFIEIYKITKGHPLFLELIDTGGEYGAYTDFRRYLYEEVLMKLPPKQREVLWRISIHRYPVRVQGLFVEGNVDYEVLNELLDKAIIQHVGEDTYDIHDMLRDFFYSTLPTATRERMHLEAARYYLDNPGDREIIEAIYHLIKSRDISSAVSLLIEHGDSLLRKGYGDRILNLIENINIKGVDEGYWSDIYLTKAKAQISIGEHEKAQGNLYQVLILGERMNNRHTVAEALRELGNIWSLKGKYEKALENYNEALDIAKEIDDARGIAMCYMGIGDCLRAKGDLSASLEMYRNAEEYAKKTRDDVLLGRIYTEVGASYLNKGDFTLAEEMLLKAINTLDVSGAQHEKAPALLMLGTLAYHKGRFEDAIEYYERCIEIAEVTNNIRVHAQALYYLAMTYGKMAQWDKAKSIIEMAEDAFMRMDDRPMVIKCMEYRTKMAMAMDDRVEMKRIIKRAKALASDMGYDTTDIVESIKSYIYEEEF